MLLTPAAHSARHLFDQRLNPGFRDSESARLLADSHVLLNLLARDVESIHLRRDLLDVAARIEDFLLDTLSELRVSKEDVEGRFDVLRAGRESWPTSIPDESWERLRSSRLLRDISDVICGGGGYWEAIDFAIQDEFDDVHSRSEPARTLYHAVDGRDWWELEQLANRLTQDHSESLKAVLNRVEARNAERFAMVVWSTQDILDAVARRRDDARDDLEEASWDEAAVSHDWVEQVMDSAGRAITDRMTERGWDVLDEVISEIGLPDT